MSDFLKRRLAGTVLILGTAASVVTGTATPALAAPLPGLVQIPQSSLTNPADFKQVTRPAEGTRCWWARDSTCSARPARWWWTTSDRTATGTRPRPW